MDKGKLPRVETQTRHTPIKAQSWEFESFL